jgi:hypothetical protein
MDGPGTEKFIAYPLVLTGPSAKPEKERIINRKVKASKQKEEEFRPGAGPSGEKPGEPVPPDG